MRVMLQESGEMVTKLVQICYRDEQRKHCYPFAEVYFNEKLTMFYENEVIVKIVMNETADRVGVCSWKLRSKLRWNVGTYRPITDEVINEPYDVLSFTKHTESHDMLGIAETWHKGFNAYFSQMLEAIGARRPIGRIKVPVYQNHFIAKTSIYQDYVTRYLRPAMEILSGEMKEIALMDSKYSKLVNDVDAGYLKQQIGVPHAPMAPFLLERLFSVYCQNEGIKVSQL